jgi:hypothetical protein
VVLNSNDKGEVSLDELRVFVELAGDLDLAAQKSIRPYAHGLRATRVSGEGGPHLDWRD